jgi:hypothetical protein
MENRRLKLPIGIQTFETIRTEGYIYVDKTKYLINLIDTGQIYFLARPRRFGKSLTVSTFDALFSGKKELFKGLYAEEFLNRPNFKPSPVIWLDMSKVITDLGIDELEKSIVKQIKDIADDLDVTLSDSKSSGSLLDDLIIRTARKNSQKVVILLDEYDSPYTDFVNDPEMAEKVREALRNYYVQIKANDEYIRFTFITGISKFARFGVFSTLNTPNDISLTPKYAEMCGYTEDEIIQYFPDYLEETAKGMNLTTTELIEKMRRYYNGFSFDDEAKARLYNPFSTLSFFAKKSFTNHWINTGRSKLIADYMKNRNLTVEQFHNFPVSVDFAESPGDMDTTPPEGFLYQSGYLTLREGTTDDLSLDYPNTEVLNSMSALVAQNILRDGDEDYSYCRSDLLKGLMMSDENRIISAFNRLLASIPYDDFSSAARQSISDNDYEFPVQEWLYRSTILAFLRGCGVVVIAEMHTNLGRADLVVSHKGKTWVIELKVAHEGENPEQKAEEALRQIIDKNYAAPYPDAVCIGMAIDDTVRAITNYKLRITNQKQTNQK